MNKCSDCTRQHTIYCEFCDPVFEDYFEKEESEKEDSISEDTQ